MQLKDILLLLAAAGSAVNALPAPGAEAQDAPVRRAEQAEQAEQATQEKQGGQWVNPLLNGLPPGGNLGFQGLSINDFQQDPRWDPRFNPRFQNQRLNWGNNNGFPSFFGNNFKRDVEAEYNPLARRAEQAEQGKQLFPGFGNNGFGGNGLDGNSMVAGGIGGGGVILGEGNNGFGNNGFRNKWNRPGFFPNNRFNQLGGGFPGRFGNNFPGDDPFEFSN